jgi:hypothetical protein
VVIADTSVGIDFLNGANTPQADWLVEQLGAQRLGVVDLTACEVPLEVHAGRDVEGDLCGHARIVAPAAYKQNGGTCVHASPPKHSTIQTVS